MILSDRETRAARARGAIHITPDPAPTAWSSTAVDLMLDGPLFCWQVPRDQNGPRLICPHGSDFDFAALKRFDLGKETRFLQFRAEIFNIFNHPNFDNPNVTETSSTFGKITSAGVQDSRASSRQIQFALRLAF
jgi:hypothetical protein